jgi:OsmC-like protein
MQAPLKERYREDPAAGVVTLKADGSLVDGIACSVRTGGALKVAGLHPATGGDGTQLCSSDMLVSALAACAGVTLKSVATSLEIDVRGGTVHAEGDLDFRGTLAVACRLRPAVAAPPSAPGGRCPPRSARMRRSSEDESVTSSKEPGEPASDSWG